MTKASIRPRGGNGKSPKSNADSDIGSPPKKRAKKIQPKDNIQGTGEQEDKCFQPSDLSSKPRDPQTRGDKPDLSSGIASTDEDEDAYSVPGTNLAEMADSSVGGTSTKTVDKALLDETLSGLGQLRSLLNAILEKTEAAGTMLQTAKAKPQDGAGTQTAEAVPLTAPSVPKPGNRLDRCPPLGALSGTAAQQAATAQQLMKKMTDLAAGGSTPAYARPWGSRSMVAALPPAAKPTTVCWGNLLSESRDQPHCPLTGNMVTLGRSSRCQVSLRDPAISNLVCRLHWCSSQKTATLECCTSSSSLHWNQTHMHKGFRGLLRSGDQIQITGAKTYSFVLELLPPPESPTSKLNPASSLADSNGEGEEGQQTAAASGAEGSSASTRASNFLEAEEALTEIVREAEDRLQSIRKDAKKLKATEAPDRDTTQEADPCKDGEQPGSKPAHAPTPPFSPVLFPMTLSEVKKDLKKAALLNSALSSNNKKEVASSKADTADKPKEAKDVKSEQNTAKLASQENDPSIRFAKVALGQERLPRVRSPHSGTTPESAKMVRNLKIRKKPPLQVTNAMPTNFKPPEKPKLSLEDVHAVLQQKEALREAFEEMVVSPSDIKVRFSDFPDYLSIAVRERLVASCLPFLQVGRTQEIESLMSKLNLPRAGFHRSMLLMAPEGCDLYVERVVSALAKETGAALLKLMPENLPAVFRIHADIDGLTTEEGRSIGIDPSQALSPPAQPLLPKEDEQSQQALLPRPVGATNLMDKNDLAKQVEKMLSPQKKALAGSNPTPDVNIGLEKETDDQEGAEQTHEAEAAANALLEEKWLPAPGYPVPLDVPHQFFSHTVGNKRKRSAMSAAVPSENTGQPPQNLKPPERPARHDKKTKNMQKKFQVGDRIKFIGPSRRKIPVGAKGLRKIGPKTYQLAVDHFAEKIRQTASAVRGPQMGYRGKIVLTFNENSHKVGVRFDKPIVGGNNLGGRCEEDRGFFCAASDLRLESDCSLDDCLEEAAIDCLFEVAVGRDIPFPLCSFDDILSGDNKSSEDEPEKIKGEKRTEPLQEKLLNTLKEDGRYEIVSSQGAQVHSTTALNLVEGKVVHFQEDPVLKLESKSVVRVHEVLVTDGSHCYYKTEEGWIQDKEQNNNDNCILKQLKGPLNTDSGEDTSKPVEELFSTPSSQRKKHKQDPENQVSKETQDHDQVNYQTPVVSEDGDNEVSQMNVSLEEKTSCHESQEKEAQPMALEEERSGKLVEEKSPLTCPQECDKETTEDLDKASEKSQVMQQDTTKLNATPPPPCTLSTVVRGILRRTSSFSSSREKPFRPCIIYISAVEKVLVSHYERYTKFCKKILSLPPNVPVVVVGGFVAGSKRDRFGSGFAGGGGFLVSKSMGNLFDLSFLDSLNRGGEGTSFKPADAFGRNPRLNQQLSKGFPLKIPFHAPQHTRDLHHWRQMLAQDAQTMCQGKNTTALLERLREANIQLEKGPRALDRLRILKNSVLTRTELDQLLGLAVSLELQRRCQKDPSATPEKNSESKDSQQSECLAEDHKVQTADQKEKGGHGDKSKSPSLELEVGSASKMLTMASPESFTFKTDSKSSQARAGKARQQIVPKTVDLGSSVLTVSKEALVQAASLISQTKAESENIDRDLESVTTDNEFEKRLLQESVIPPGETGVAFKDVQVEDVVKSTLIELVMLPLKRPELFRRGHLTAPCKGILLFGPPGTGKTMLAKAVATEAGAHFIHLTMSSIASKWFGEGEKYVKATFTLASKMAPAIIFIDEVDSMLGRREKHGEHEAMRKIKNEFMSSWDGLRSNPLERVTVLGITNRPFDLDDAVLRRFPRRLLVDMPDANLRSRILQSILADEALEKGFDCKKLGRDDITGGFSGSDLKNMCIAAAYRPIREIINKESNLERSETVEKSSKSIKKEVVQNDEETDFEGREAKEEEIELRKLKISDFEAAAREIGTSTSEDSFTMQEIRKWNDMYGEGGSRKKTTLSYYT